MNLQSSQDILFIVLAFCALLFTLFVCVMLGYFIRILRDASNIVGEVRDKLHAIDEAIRDLHEKLEHSASYLGVVAGGVKLLVSILGKSKDKAAEKAEKVVSKLKKK